MSEIDQQFKPEERNSILPLFSPIRLVAICSSRKMQFNPPTPGPTLPHLRASAILVDDLHGRAVRKRARA